MKYYTRIDINGNKTVHIKPDNERGFCIQTNGNLPHTHRETQGRFGKFIPDAITINEILHYVADYGTDRQKSIMPLPCAPAVGSYGSRIG